jgi:hypothetical protein
LPQKLKYLGVNLTIEVKHVYSENYKLLKKKIRLQKTENSPMLMDSQDQHCENGYITKSNLHVQHNFHQNSNDTHQRDQKINPKVHLEAQ